MSFISLFLFIHSVSEIAVPLLVYTYIWPAVRVIMMLCVVIAVIVLRMVSIVIMIQMKEEQYYSIDLHELG